jgi:hypothetical protein
MNSLGQDEGVEEFKKTIASLAAQEQELRRAYDTIVAAVNTYGAVPAALIVEYMKASQKVNELLQENSRLHKLAGGADIPPVLVPMVGVKRAYRPDELLAVEDLEFIPCPQMGLGIAMMAPAAPTVGRMIISYGGQALVALIIGGAVVWGLKEYRLLRTKKYDAQIANFASHTAATKAEVEKTKMLLDSYGTHMAKCSGLTGNPLVTCMNRVAADLAALAAAAETDKPKMPEEGGLGFFGWLGVIVFTGAVATVGYVWWQKRGKQKIEIEVARRRYEDKERETAEESA